MIKRIIILSILVGIISLACSLPGSVASTPTPYVITATSAPFTDTPPNTETPVFTSTFTLSPTVESSNTPTLTPTLGIAMVTPSSVNVNCRFGPSLDYLATGALVVGETVPITGKLSNNSWWEIENKLDPGKKCWVAASATTTIGNLAPVPVKSAPDAYVTKVSISAPETIHGHCGGPNGTSFEVSITTNGPASVNYYMAIYNGDGTLRNQLSTSTKNFASADTKTFDPAGAYSTDCGDYYAVVYVTSPNELSARVDWTVVEP